MPDWLDKIAVPLIVAVLGTAVTYWVAGMTSRRSDKGVRSRLRALLRIVYGSLDVILLAPNTPVTDRFLPSAEAQFRELIFAPETIFAVSASEATLLYELTFILRASVEAMDKLDDSLSGKDEDSWEKEETDDIDYSLPENAALRKAKLEAMRAIDQQFPASRILLQNSDRMLAKLMVDKSWGLAVMGLKLLGDVAFLKASTSQPNRKRLDHVLVKGWTGPLPPNPIVVPTPE